MEEEKEYNQAYLAYDENHKVYKICCVAPTTIIRKWEEEYNLVQILLERYNAIEVTGTNLLFFNKENGNRAIEYIKSLLMLEKINNNM